MANKKGRAQQARGIKAKVIDLVSSHKPDESVDLLVDFITSGLDGRTAEGKALRKIIPHIREHGLSVRQLEAMEITRLFRLMRSEREGTIDAKTAQIHAAKISDQLRKLVEMDDTTITSAPANIAIKIDRPVDKGPGDRITIRSANTKDPDGG